MTAPVIAVVDDDVYIGDMLQELLTREGYEVLRAYSGTETLLLLESRKPDLILLDPQKDTPPRSIRISRGNSCAQPPQSLFPRTPYSGAI